MKQVSRPGRATRIARPGPAATVLALALLGAALGVQGQQAAPEPGRTLGTLPATQVTAIGESVSTMDTPQSIGAVGEDSIRLVKQTPASQLLSEVPGVGVAAVNGTGTTLGIRQPFTNSPVYLFMQDGVPTNSAGFYNRNSLLELNFPYASRVEITRGPGTALYGSDAIGGIVNEVTRAPGMDPSLEGSFEAGSYGWRRLLAGGEIGYSDRDSTGAARLDMDFAHRDGWRDSTKSDRSSVTARWDNDMSATEWLKTIVSYTNADQHTGGDSPLIEDDYRNNPTRNYTPFGFRKVEAILAQSAYQQQFGTSLLSVTPYFRSDKTDLLAPNNLSFDPSMATTQNRSAGLLTKWRSDFPKAMRARLIAGLDLDYSPGGRQEDAVVVKSTGTGAARQFTSYIIGPRIYEYDIQYRSISPYVHGEISPLEALRLSAGLRYDHSSYAFHNRKDAVPLNLFLPFPGSRWYGQSADTTLNFDELSPKFGATWALNTDTHVFASYNHGLRVPSEGDLFRPAIATTAAAATESAASALHLEAVKADQVELGLKGRVMGDITYELTAYDLEKRDDIVSQKDPVTNLTQTVNAGKTQHRGVELGAGVPFLQKFRFDVAFSYAKHKYADWASSAGDFSGKDMEAAPQTLANARLTWAPVTRATVQLEAVHTGSYWMDAANTTKYGGQTLINARASWPLQRYVSIFGSVNNIADKQYADSASFSSGTPVYSPGLPRAYYGGVEVKW